MRLKKLVLLFHPIKSKPEPIGTCLHRFSPALCQLHVITACFDCMVSFVIGQNDYFGFGFATLN